MQIHVGIDFETRSQLDIMQVGAFKYFEHPSTDILCLAYAVNDGVVESWTPEMLKHAPLFSLVSDPRSRFFAWNATFEMLCWEKLMVGKYGWPPLPDHRWYDTQAVAVSRAYPADLGSAALAMGVRTTKLESGKRLIHKFSKPNNLGGFNDPVDDLDEYRELIKYNKRDVEVERDMRLKLDTQLSPFERKLWLQTVKINRRGIHIDTSTCRELVRLIAEKRSRLNASIAAISGGKITAMTQRERVRKWLGEHCKVQLENMQGPTLEQAVHKIDSFVAENGDYALLKEAKIVIRWYMQANQSSLAKYEKILSNLCLDRTVKGFLFYHAAVPGRYGGRGVQFQNFPRLTHRLAEQIVDCLREPNLDLVELITGDIFAVSKKLLRAVIMAPPGKYLCVADFKSIEAVGSAWVCDEDDILQSFVRGEDQYRQTASKMYNTEYALVTPDMRHAGKIAVLACGYGGGPKAILGMARQMRMDVSDDQAMLWTGQFRAARPLLVQAWDSTEHAAKQALLAKEGDIISVDGVKGLQFSRSGDDLRMHLPSGREVNYPDALIVSEIYDREIINLDDDDDPPKKKRVVTEFKACWRNSTTHQWEERYLYGSLLFQNYIQALCRDILAEAQLRVEEHGFEVCISVHDEVGALVDNNDPATEKKFISVMTQRPEWLDDKFPILADGFIARRYKK